MTKKDKLDYDGSDKKHDIELCHYDNFVTDVGIFLSFKDNEFPMDFT